MKRSIVLFLVLFIAGAGSAFAAPITVDKILGTNSVRAKIDNLNNGNERGYASEYLLQTNQGDYDAFCVENSWGTAGSFDLLSISNDYAQRYAGAAWVAEQYWNGSWGYNKEQTQVIIWELVLGEMFEYIRGADFVELSGESQAEAFNRIFNDIYGGGNGIGISTDRVYLVHSPFGSTYEPPEGSQDYLIQILDQHTPGQGGHPTPEPGTIILLGLGLIGFASIGRSKLLGERLDT